MCLVLVKSGVWAYLMRLLKYISFQTKKSMVGTMPPACACWTEREHSEFKIQF